MLSLNFYQFQLTIVFSVKSRSNLDANLSSRETHAVFKVESVFAFKHNLVISGIISLTITSLSI